MFKSLKRSDICLLGEYKKDELLEAARSGNEEKLMALLTTLNVNCHASDGRKVSQMLFTIKYFNFRTTENFAVIYLKFKKRDQASGYFVKMIEME